jgi:hypothetical protein
MSNSNLPQREPNAPRRAAPPAPSGRWARRPTLLIGALVLQAACSLLIEIDDGGDEVATADASTAEAPIQPHVPEADAGRGAPELVGDAGSDAGTVPPEGAPQGTLQLAFIEHPEEGEATLQLVDVHAALRSRTGEPPTWRRALRPSAGAGDVFDFAWSPDARRLAVRHDTLDGPRMALFAAPDWRELPIAPLGSPARQPRLTPAARYRWAPDGATLAVELAGEGGPLVGGYSVADTGARELAPVALTGPVQTLEWLSPSSLFVIQPEAGEPELLELGLSDGAFATPVERFLIGAFFPIELRRGPAGVLGASTDPTNFLFFWPETPDAGFESAFTPSAYLSGQASFAAEPDDVAASSALFPIGDSSRVLDTLPSCPIVLAWSEGPSSSSLAGSSLACLSVSGDVASLGVHAYDAAGVRHTLPLDDAELRADYASAPSWESHARAWAGDGSWLALATAEHDAIIDLRGPSPLYQLRPAAVDGSTARGFSPSGRYLLEQRGARVELVVLSPAPGAAPIRVPLPAAAAELAACDLARHLPTSCGSPRAARRAAARWSSNEDVASLLASGEGLVLLAPTPDTVGVARVAVSTCGSGCVTQYQFAE